MKTRTAVVGLIAVLLFGCGSFNRSEHYTIVNGDREAWAREVMGPPPVQRHPNRVATGKVSAPKEAEEDTKVEEKKPEVKPTPKPAPKPVTRPARRTTAAAAPTAKPVAKPDDPKPALCPMYVPPPLGKVPELPLEELEKVKDDPAKIDALERQHIVDLRNYILERRKVALESRNKYLEECQKIIQNSTPAPR